MSACISTSQFELSTEILDWLKEGEYLFSPCGYDNYSVIGLDINYLCIYPINENLITLGKIPKNVEQISAQKKQELISLINKDLEEFPIDLPID